MVKSEVTQSGAMRGKPKEARQAQTIPKRWHGFEEGGEAPLLFRRTLEAAGST